MTKKGHQKFWLWKWKFFPKKRHSEILVREKFFLRPPKPSNLASGLRHWPPGRSKCPTTPLFSMLCPFLEFRSYDGINCVIQSQYLVYLNQTIAPRMNNITLWTNELTWYIFSTFLQFLNHCFFYYCVRDIIAAHRFFYCALFVVVRFGLRVLIARCVVRLTTKFLRLFRLLACDRWVIWNYLWTCLWTCIYFWVSVYVKSQIKL